MTNNSVKYEVFAKQYLRANLDIIDQEAVSFSSVYNMRASEACEPAQKYAMHNICL